MRRLLQVLCLALAAALIPAVVSVAEDSDLRATFLASNPNGGWEYGFHSEEGEFVAYNTTFDDGKGIAGWCLDKCPGVNGDVTINYTDLRIDRYGSSWEPSQVSLCPPSRGGATVIRWHSSIDGEVVIDSLITGASDKTSAAVIVDGEVVSTDKASASQPTVTATSSSKAKIIKVRVKKKSTVDLVVATPEGGIAGPVGVSVYITPEGPSQSKSASLGIRRRA